MIKKYSVEYSYIQPQPWRIIGGQCPCSLPVSTGLGAIYMVMHLKMLKKKPSFLDAKVFIEDKEWSFKPVVV